MATPPVSPRLVHGGSDQGTPPVSTRLVHGGSDQGNADERTTTVARSLFGIGNEEGSAHAGFALESLRNDDGSSVTFGATLQGRAHEEWDDTSVQSAFNVGEYEEREYDEYNEYNEYNRSVNEEGFVVQAEDVEWEGVFDSPGVNVGEEHIEDYYNSIPHASSHSGSDIENVHTQRSDAALSDSASGERSELTQRSPRRKQSMRDYNDDQEQRRGSLRHSFDEGALALLRDAGMRNHVTTPPPSSIVGSVHTSVKSVVGSNQESPVNEEKAVLISTDESDAGTITHSSVEAPGFFGSVWNGIAAVGTFFADFLTAVFHVLTCHCFDSE